MHTQLRNPEVHAEAHASTQVDLSASHIAWQAALSYDSASWNEAWPAKELFPMLLHPERPTSE